MKRKRIYAWLLVVALFTAMLSGCGKKEKLGPFEVVFDPNGGSRVSGNLKQTVEWGEAAREPQVERDGYVFSGWDTEFTDIRKDTIVVAEWKKAIKVTFDLDGGTVDSGKEEVFVASGKKPTAPTVSKKGYRFTGWDKEVTTVREDTVYVAQWERLIPSAEEVYASLTNSMVEIHTYDKNGQGIALGSGFFIDENGTVLTNFHVMEGAYTAKIIMYNEIDYMVSKVEGYDKDIDLCVIQTVASNTEPVKIFQGDVKTGEPIYTLGSSVGLTGTFSNGIVSTASRIMDGIEYIQITAPISHGNSGGPLVNEYGEVLGVNTFMVSDAQNLNFAVSIKELDNIDRSSPLTIHQFGTATGANVQPHYTAVETGDEGENVYKIAGQIEFEPNDSIAKANELTINYWCAGYVNKGEVDYYKFTVSKAEMVGVYLTAYWHDDDYYVYATIRDSEGKVMDEKKIKRDPKIDIRDYEAGTYMHAAFQLPKAGTYYIDVHLPKNYPYKNGCYYMIAVEE
ncbi:MAG: trypsin-like peptidase domain-containing protein [Lachnospiraceae bacterium]|nr:trypsin-like peptidase domain-containing protein [Lachnospiraceae bacterium]